MIDNAADTFDLYIETAADGAGDAVLPTSAPVAVGVPFNVATANALTGALFNIQGASGNVNYIDEISWLVGVSE